MRKPIIAGNWKMNNTIAATKALISDLIPLVKDAACDVVICTPYTDLATAVEMCKGTNIKVGAENVHWAEKGAFTGEISADMLVELGVEYVIIGHSERRQYFGETDATVNARVKAALAKGLKPIICVGETLEEREAGKTAEVDHKGHKGYHGETVLPQMRRRQSAHSVRRQHESQKRQRAYGYARDRRRSYRRREPESGRFFQSGQLLISVRRSEATASDLGLLCRFNGILTYGSYNFCSRFGKRLRIKKF